MTSEAAANRPIIFSIKSYPCMPKTASSCGGPPVASRPTKHLVSKNGLGWPQNDLGGFRDQAYHFQHQKLSLHAQSREPFHTGHCRPFRTNTQTASGGLKMTSEAAGTRPIIFSIKLPLYARSREPFHTGHCRPFRTNTQTASGGLKMTSEAAGTRPIIFSIKLPLYARSREPFHTGYGRPFQTNMQANKEIPLCFISIYI